MSKAMVDVPISNSDLRIMRSMTRLGKPVHRTKVVERFIEMMVHGNKSLFSFFWICFSSRTLEEVFHYLCNHHVEWLCDFIKGLNPSYRSIEVFIGTNDENLLKPEVCSALEQAGFELQYVSSFHNLIVDAISDCDFNTLNIIGKNGFDFTMECHIANTSYLDFAKDIPNTPAYLIMMKYVVPYPEVKVAD